MTTPLRANSSDGQLLRVLRATADFLYKQGVDEGASAVDEVVRWVESYGEPEDWAKRAQAAHNRAENLYEALSGLLVYARGNQHVLDKIHAALEANRG